MWLGSCRAIDVAVKVPVNSRRITAKQLEAFQAEVKIMRSAASHPIPFHAKPPRVSLPVWNFVTVLRKLVAHALPHGAILR